MSSPAACALAAGDVAQMAERIHAELLDLQPDGMDRAGVSSFVRDRLPLLPAGSLGAVVDRVMARIEGLGALEPLLEDPDITDVLVNGPGPVWIERSGSLEQVDLELSESEIYRVIERVVGPLGLRVDRSSPLVDARLPDGSRVNAVVPPLAVDGPCLAIRRFGVRSRTLDELADGPVCELLRWSLEARLNILVSGGTGAGKTTLLNALAAELPGGQRIITVEDTAELRLSHPHVIRLEARPPNADGAGSVGIRELVRNALRMRPDRIIVGEVRGPEALDMLQAMNTGHEGSLSTCHANSPADALRRIETMVLLDESAVPLGAVREQISAALDLVVQTERGPGGDRFVGAVAEVETEPEPGRRLRVRTLAQGGVLVAPPLRPPRAPCGPAPHHQDEQPA